MSLTGGLIPLGGKSSNSRGRPIYDFDDNDDIDAILESDSTSSKPSQPLVRKSSNNRSSSMKGRNNTRLSDSFESLPSPMNQSKNLNTSIGDDSLSPASSAANSPVSRTQYNTQAKEDIQYPKQSTNPFAEVSATSADLEDSILGGLLGPTGGNNKKATTKANAARASLSKLEPIEKDSPTSPQEPSKYVIAPTGFRPKGGSSPRTAPGNNINNSSFDDSVDLSSPKNAHPSGKSNNVDNRKNVPAKADDSVDFDDFELPMASSESRSRSPSPTTFASSIAAFSSRNNSTHTASTSVAISAGPSTGPVNAIPATATSTSSKPSDDVDMGGFLPSFLDPERRSRQRRNIGGRALKPGGNDDGLDELDKALGLGFDSIGGTKQKTIVDPFSNISSRITSITENSGKISGNINSAASRPPSNQSPPSSLRAANSSHRHASISFSSVDSDDSDKEKPISKQITSSISSHVGDKGDRGGEPTVLSSGSLPVALPSTAAPLSSMTTGTTQQSLFPSLQYSSSNPNSQQRRSVFPSSSIATDISDHEDIIDSNTAASYGGNSTVSSNSAVAKKNAKSSSGKTVSISIPIEESTGTAPSGRKPSYSSNNSNSSKVSIDSVDKPDSEQVYSSSSSSSLNYSGQPAGALAVQLTQSTEFNPSSSGDFGFSSQRRNTNTPAWLSSPSHTSSNNNNNTNSFAASNSSQLAGGGLAGPGSFNVVSGTSSSGNTQQSGSTSNMRSPGFGGEQQNYVARNLQLKLEETTLEKEAVERQLRLEIDSLRNKLLNSTPALIGINAASKPPKDEESQQSALGMNNDYVDAQTKFAREKLDLNSIIRQLELENARLKDEVIIAGAKHKEEISYLQTRFETETSDLKKRNGDEIRSLEQRHAETISALKAIHQEEVKGIRERSKDKIILEQLSGQISNTSGSIKLIEEQLHSRYRGFDAVREGQHEARERLIEELESQAKQRVEAAETESYKLKGLLIHMEQMMGTMKQQGQEEKLRLQQETDRLSSMQASMELEKRSMQTRMDEELQIVKSKMKEIERDQRQFHEEKRLHHESVIAATSKAEQSKAEFKRLVEENARSIDASAKKLKEEEARFDLIRQELARESQQIQEAKQQLKQESRQLQELKAGLHQAELNLQSEKFAIQQTATQLQHLSEDVSKQFEEIDAAQQSMVEREEALRLGMQDIRQSSQGLSQKEQELMNLKQLLESRHILLEKQGQEFDRIKIIKFGQERQQLSMFAQQTSSLSYNDNTNKGFVNISTKANENEAQRSNRQSIHSDNRSAENDNWLQSFKHKLANSAGAKVLMLNERYDVNIPSESNPQDAAVSGYDRKKSSWSADYLNAQEQLSRRENLNREGTKDYVVDELRKARMTVNKAKAEYLSPVYNLETDSFLARERELTSRLHQLKSQR